MQMVQGFHDLFRGIVGLVLQMRARQFGFLRTKPVGGAGCENLLLRGRKLIWLRTCSSSDSWFIIDSLQAIGFFIYDTAKNPIFTCQ